MHGRSKASGATSGGTGGAVPRGVWRAPYERNGWPVAIAVTSRRQCVGEVVLAPGVNRLAARRFLEQLLEQCDDAKPQLSLVDARRWPDPATPPAPRRIVDEPLPWELPSPSESQPFFRRRAGE